MSTNAPMRISARHATVEDVPELLRMYRALAAEQSAIRSIWPSADGLAEPVGESLTLLLDREDAITVIGEIDGVPTGFLIAVEEPLLEPVSDRSIGVVQFIFTDHEARGVGIGAAMLDVAMTGLEERGIDLFDARVSPGHRLAKNFFESNGFKARSITMHRSDAGSDDFAPDPNGTAGRST
ncbi:MAG: GNAT family N-acetyltransferase [Actinomycetota bacterium]|nr:GNAT family N-acetyltransferase [Actinomycetota bacterium]